MRSLTWGTALPVAVAILFTASGCARKDEAPPVEATGPESAAPVEPAAEAAPASGEAAVAEGAAASADAAAAPDAAAAAIAAATPAASAADGAKVYQTFCVTCHGAKGAGDGPAAMGLNPKPASFATRSFKYDPNGNGTKGDVEDIKAIVHDGAAKHGGSPLMAPWPMVNPAQLQAVAEYVKSLGA